MNSAIYCEGYQDRAFLSAWFEWLAERDCFHLEPVKNPVDRVIKVKDSHTKRTKGRELAIIAGEGDSDLAERAALLVRKWAPQQLDRLALVVDADRSAADARASALEASFKHRAPGFTGTLSVLVWEPQLEVVIEQALRAARSAELAAIDLFLKQAPSPTATKKEPSFAFCSAWEPDCFGDSFFRRVWNMTDVRVHLEASLKRSEAVLLSLL